MSEQNNHIEDKWRTEQYFVDSDKYPFSRAWWQRSRWSGDGPPYSKVGNTVLYNERLVDEWFKARMINNTSQGPQRKRKPVPPQLRDKQQTQSAMSA